jgi:hypothetical protein
MIINESLQKMVYCSFPEKNQKRLPCGATTNRLGIVLFQKNKKRLPCRQQTRRSRPRGSGGVPPAKLYVKEVSSFPEKKQKRWFCFAEETVGYPNLGEADPGGLGACPQQNSTLRRFLLFQKRSKSVGSASQKRQLGTQTSAKPTQWVLGRAPSKTLR